MNPEMCQSCSMVCPTKVKHDWIINIKGLLQNGNTDLKWSKKEYTVIWNLKGCCLSLISMRFNGHSCLQVWNFLCFVFSFAMKMFGFGRFGSYYKNISQC